MILDEYMKIRMGSLYGKCNALTAKEAEIFGFKMSKGWFEKNKHMVLTDDMLVQLRSIDMSTNKFILRVKPLLLIPDRETIELNGKHYEAMYQDEFVVLNGKHYKLI